MDNLPFASVVAFLDAASKPSNGSDKKSPYVRRPEHAPHLIVTGSLEPNCHRLYPKRTNEVRKCWVTLKKRAGKIRYNKKIHDFEVAERDMHKVWEGAGFKRGGTPDEPLDIEVVAVKPEWLCGTFAFHPMLGFKRRRQAASIAHGCAGTLKEMKRLWDKRNNGSANPYFWGMEPEKVKEIKNDIQKPKTDGICWFCDTITCPFSKVALAKQDPNMKRERPKTHKALMSIYRECGKTKTHPDPIKLKKTDCLGGQGRV